MNRIFVGMSGWTFEGWRGSFYPEGLKQKDELAYASRHVRSIEVNGTFYSLFRPSSYEGWYQQTPPDFQFSLKAPKYITHERRLKDFETPLSNFLASGILALGEKLGPILWQFPPSLPFDPTLFEPFMAALPHDMKSAAKLGESHSSWLDGRTHLEVPTNHRLRHVIEGRHSSFLSPAFVEMARKYGIGIVVGDTDGRWPYIEDVTTDFVYLRLHGDATKHPNGYSKADLERWAHRFQCWSEGSQANDAVLVVQGEPTKTPRQVFAYFDNETKETASINAVSMESHLLQLGLLTGRSINNIPELVATKTAKAKDTKVKETEKKISKLKPKTKNISPKSKVDSKPKPARKRA